MASALRSARLIARVVSSMRGATSTSGAIAAAAAPRAALALAGPRAVPGLEVFFSARAYSSGGVSPLQGLPGVSPLQAPPGSAEGSATGAGAPAAVRPRRALRGREAQRARFDAVGPYGEPLYSKHVSRSLAISPSKLNDFAKVVRGLSTRDALIQCQMSVKKSAALVGKAVAEAAKKAVESNGADAEALTVAEAWVGRGTHLKRMFPSAKGRGNARLKYRAHLTIVIKAEATPNRTRVVPTILERDAKRRAALAVGAGVVA